MLEQAKFKSALTSFATSQTKLFAKAQELAIYCIFHACQHKNVEPVKQLMDVLLVPDGKKTVEGKEVTKYRPKSNDAKRILQFVQDFCPCSINMERGTVKYMGKRADAGLQWQGSDTAYPLWHVWVKADKPTQLKVVDGVGLFKSEIVKLVKRVKEGKVMLTPESKAAFDSLVTQTDKAISTIIEAQQKEVA